MSFLGRGLESLIPNKDPDSIPGILPSVNPPVAQTASAPVAVPLNSGTLAGESGIAMSPDPTQPVPPEPMQPVPSPAVSPAYPPPSVPPPHPHPAPQPIPPQPVPPAWPPAPGPIPPQPAPPIPETPLAQPPAPPPPPQMARTAFSQQSFRASPDDPFTGYADSSASPASARSMQDHFMPRRGESVFWIELEKIDPNPFQPRREFVSEALQDLANSIREHGVLQPVLVTKKEIETTNGLDVRYELIAGERRFRAARIAGLTQIPAMVRRGVPDDRIRLELALIENVQREDLNPLERAKAYKQLVDEFHMVQRDIASRIGKSREMVANTLRLLSLPDEIQQAMVEGRISEGHARAVLMAGDDLASQHDVYNAILTDRLNVREAESKARQIGGKILVPRKRPSQVQDPEMREWQNRLQDRLGTKVQMTRMGSRGKIVMEFYSEEELRGLLDKLIKEV